MPLRKPPKVTGLIRIVEVHPGAAFILRGAPRDAVLTFKSDESGRRTLLGWLRRTGMTGFDVEAECSEHFLAACAAACAAYDWSSDRHKWVARAVPPWHPYDFAC